jgi:dTDP-4-dehydrorhamnose 3,5-epimerase
MIFTRTRVDGAFVIGLETREDIRGFFARAWCRNEFRSHNLAASFVQCNLSFNHRQGTLRGMHYQTAPYEEAKLVRCIAGGIYNVVLDLRPDSATYKDWVAVELTAANRRMLYIPEGCAAGYQTLADNSEVFYQLSQFYAPEAERGARWNDPAFAIEWPERQPRVISEKDAAWPDYVEPSPDSKRLLAQQGRP